MKDLGKAKKTYRRWHDKNPGEMISLNIPGLKMNGPWVIMGTMPDILYTSDKWEKEAHDYIHNFSVPPFLVCDPAGKVMMIVGGKYKITERGIVG